MCHRFAGSLLGFVFFISAGDTALAGRDAERLNVAVMELTFAETIPRDFAESLAAIVPDALESTGAFAAISSNEIKQMLAAEALKQSLGCASDAACLAEIGGALGVSYLVAGGVSLVGDTYLVQLQLLNVAAATVANRVVREFEGGPKGMFEEMRVATRLLVRDLLAERSGKLMVTATEEGATIKVDNSIMGVAPLEAALVLAEGMHSVVVEKDGFIQFRRDVVVQRDEGTFLEARLRPSQDFLDSYRTEAGAWRIAGWSAVGLGAAGLAGGLTALLVGNGKSSDLARDIEAYNRSDVRTATALAEIRSREKELATLDTLTLSSSLVGLLAAGVGVAILFLGPDPGRYTIEPSVTGSSPQASLSPSTIYVELCGLGLCGNF